jgi:hypothetical protein
MKLLISRTYESNYTLGQMFVMNGHELVHRCKCIELPWLSNQRNVSCIPEGEYNAVREMNAVRGKVFRLLWVRDRSGILVHPGNFVAGYVKDSEGCILPGNYFEDINNDGNLDIAESREAMNTLYNLMPDRFKIIVI